MEKAAKKQHVTNGPEMPLSRQVATTEPKPKHWRDLGITGFGLLVEALALLFGVSILTLGAATLLWLALRDYRSEQLKAASRSYRIKFSVISAVMLIVGTTVTPIGMKSYLDSRKHLQSTVSVSPSLQASTLVMYTLLIAAGPGNPWTRVDLDITNPPEDAIQM